MGEVNNSLYLKSRGNSNLTHFSDSNFADLQVFQPSLNHPVFASGKAFCIIYNLFPLSIYTTHINLLGSFYNIQVLNQCFNTMISIGHHFLSKFVSESFVIHFNRVIHSSHVIHPLNLFRGEQVHLPPPPNFFSYRNRFFLKTF